MNTMSTFIYVVRLVKSGMFEKMSSEEEAVVEDHFNRLKKALAEGKLIFAGGKIDAESTIAVGAQMKKIESEIEAIKEVKHISWKLSKWHKNKGKWERKPQTKAEGE